MVSTILVGRQRACGIHLAPGYFGYFPAGHERPVQLIHTLEDFQPQILVERRRSQVLEAIRLPGEILQNRQASGQRRGLSIGAKQAPSQGHPGDRGCIRSALIVGILLQCPARQGAIGRGGGRDVGQSLSGNG